MARNSFQYEQVMRFLENVSHDSKFFIFFFFGIDRWRYIFGLSTFSDQLAYSADSATKFEGKI